MPRPSSIRSDGESSTFEQFLEFVPDAIVGVGRDGEILLVNRQAEELFGFARDEMVGRPLDLLVPERFREIHPRHRANYFEEPRTRPMGAGVELFAVRKDGSEFPVEISLSSIEWRGQTIATAAVRDISERAESEREKALQDQLQRSRRLESVGQLAGGIAHDFNNILGVIMNYAEFVADELEPDSGAREDVEEIRRAAERAAALTRQLLIFSRREVATPEVLQLGELIGELENLLQRALGERVELRVPTASGLDSIEADPGQIEQVLVNLAVNARDAMPEGGMLLIEAENVVLDEEYAYMHPDTDPGPYVRLKVSDTGTGMDQETVERAFEPFYTTKDDGTGLGLATVYGIVTGAGGRIDVYSELDFGTTVKIHLPATGAEPAARRPTDEERQVGRGEVVLVVEDEPDVKRMAERILTKAGYSVIGATRGAEAVELFEATEQRVDLLLTDVIMPEMLGTELVEHARAAQSGLRVLYMSGYSHDVLAPQALGQLRITAANALRQQQLESAERVRHATLVGSAEEKAEALRDELIEAQRRAISELRASRQETVERLARAIEMHDLETGAHVHRMASTAALLGGAVGLDPDRVRLLRTAAPMHDVGKIATPDAVLRKQGPLTAEERQLMEEHTTVGHRILCDSESELLRLAAEIALTHHEWFDGSGYPRGLSDGEIPIEGRIVAAADVFDALLSDRPYREAMPVEDATKLIVAERGTHFDPDVVDALLGNLDEALALRG